MSLFWKKSKKDNRENSNILGFLTSDPKCRTCDHAESCISAVTIDDHITLEELSNRLGAIILADGENANIQITQKVIEAALENTCESFKSMKNNTNLELIEELIDESLHSNPEIAVHKFDNEDDLIKFIKNL